jgi:peroxiredoxin Q/BCP
MSQTASVGNPFPDFTLPNQDNQATRLQDFAGKWLAVFVYPKDDTPGCTIESKGFSAAAADYAKANAQAVGLSADGVDSHKSFCNKFSLATPLLADTDGKLLTALGVGQSDYKGTAYWNRVTYLVDPQGTLRKIYRDVKPAGHEQTVLEDIRAMSAGQQP